MGEEHQAKLRCGFSTPLEFSETAEKTYEIPAARDISELVVMGDYFLLMTHGLCANDRYHVKCAYFRMFDRNGDAVGTTTRHQTGEWMGGYLFDISDFTMRLAYTQLYRPSVFTQLVWTPPGTMEEETLLELEAPDGDQPPSPKALAVDGERWALLSTEYDSERDRDRVRLSLWDGREAVVRGLPSESQLRSFGFEEDSLHLVYASSRGRPRHVVLGFDGQTLSRPTVIAENGLAPIPGGTRLEFSIGRANHRLAFVRSTAAGDAVGEHVALPSGARTADVAYIGHRFISAWLTRSGRSVSVNAATIDCHPSPTTTARSGR